MFPSVDGVSIAEVDARRSRDPHGDLASVVLEEKGDELLGLF